MRRRQLLGAAALLACAAGAKASPSQCRSADGEWLLVAEADRLQLLRTSDLSPVASYALQARDGRPSGPVQCMAALAQRRSFAVAPSGLAELWEVFLDPAAHDFYEGLVHDHRMGEGVPTRGFLGRRRIALPAPLRQLHASPDHFHLLGWDAEGQLQLINLDVRRAILRRPDPAPLTAQPLRWQGRAVLQVQRAEGLELIDFDSAESLQRRPGPVALDGGEQ